MLALCVGAASIAAQPACKFTGDGEIRPIAEADLYSGRPNPRWNPSRSATSSLRQMLATLPAGGTAVTPPSLGYRGIVLNDPSDIISDCVELRAYRGTVTGNCAGGTRVLMDANRQVESVLAESGLKQADAAAYAAVKEDLAQR